MLAFLSTGLRHVWGVLGGAAAIRSSELPDPTTRVVDHHRRTGGRVAGRGARSWRRPHVVTVMSSDAWDAYDVPMSPFFVLVDGPSGRVVGEGSGSVVGSGGRPARQVRRRRRARAAPRHQHERPGPGRPRRSTSSSWRPASARRSRACTRSPPPPRTSRDRAHRERRARGPAPGLGRADPPGRPRPAPPPRPPHAPPERRPPAATSRWSCTRPASRSPPQRGDYGSGAVEVMGGSDILICLLEHEPAAAGDALFARDGFPRLDAATVLAADDAAGDPGHGRRPALLPAGRPARSACTS